MEYKHGNHKSRKGRLRADFGVNAKEVMPDDLCRFHRTHRVYRRAPRGLADYLESNPEVPAPGYSPVHTFSPDGAWAEMCAEIDAIAARLDVIAYLTGGGHYVAVRSFGPVEYRAVRHPAQERQQAKRVKQMSPILVLVGVGVMAVSAAVTFAVLIIGIRRGDRRHLASRPQSNSDAFARRLFLGVRYPESLQESANKQTEAGK